MSTTKKSINYNLSKYLIIGAFEFLLNLGHYKWSKVKDEWRAKTTNYAKEDVAKNL